MISCILLSAGQSLRYGSPKALAEIGGSIIIQRILKVLFSSFVDEIVVVLGAHHKEIKHHLLKHKKVKVVYLSIGTDEAERMYQWVHNFHIELEKIGIKHIYYESPDTAHEWLTWKRSLKQFAGLIFK